MKERTLHSGFLKKARGRYDGLETFKEHWQHRALDKGYLNYFIAGYADDELEGFSEKAESVTYYVTSAHLNISHFTEGQYSYQAKPVGNCVLKSTAQLMRWQDAEISTHHTELLVRKRAKLLGYHSRLGLGYLRAKLLYRWCLGTPLSVISLCSGHHKAHGHYVGKKTAREELFACLAERGGMLLVDRGHPAYEGHAMAVRRMVCIYVYVTFSDGSQTCLPQLNLFVLNDGEHHDPVYLPLMWLTKFKCIVPHPYKQKTKKIEKRPDHEKDRKTK